MKKNKVGRPSKYKPEYCQNIISFFNLAPHFEKDITITKSDGTQIDKTEQTPCDLPFFSDWCHSVGVDEATMISWTTKFPEFLKAYKRAKDLQKQILIVNGLLGLYAPAFTIFTMKNICGWRDEQHIKGEGFTNIYNIIQQIQRDFQKGSGSSVELDTGNGVHDGRTRQIERHQEISGQTIPKSVV